jgi:hypothetical protein
MLRRPTRHPGSGRRPRWSLLPCRSRGPSTPSLRMTTQHRRPDTPREALRNKRAGRRRMGSAGMSRCTPGRREARCKVRRPRRRSRRGRNQLPSCSPRSPPRSLRRAEAEPTRLRSRRGLLRSSPVLRSPPCRRHRSSGKSPSCPSRVLRKPHRPAPHPGESDRPRRGSSSPSHTEACMRPRRSLRRSRPRRSCRRSGRAVRCRHRCSPSPLRRRQHPPNQTRPSSRSLLYA